MRIEHITKIDAPIARVWERTLDVRVTARGVDTKFYKEDLKQGKFMIARSGPRFGR